MPRLVVRLWATRASTVRRPSRRFHDTPLPWLNGTNASLCTTSRSYSTPSSAANSWGLRPSIRGRSQVEIDQTPCDGPAAGSDQVDRLTGHEVADDPRDTCRQQRRVVLSDCANARVQMQFAAWSTRAPTLASAGAGADRSARRRCRPDRQPTPGRWPPPGPARRGCRRWWRSGLPGSWSSSRRCQSPNRCGGCPRSVAPRRGRR